MLTWLKIATRNLFRNTRRSLFTAIAVALGYAAINTFAGFTEYMFTALRDGFIYAGGNGHLTIFKKGFLTEGQLDPRHYLLDEAESARIEANCLKDPRAELVAPQLHIVGMVGNGQVSTIAMALGSVPSKVRTIRSRARGYHRTMTLFSGRPLQDDAMEGVSLSTGLAAKLKLEPGSDAMLMAPTIEGQMNALDIKIFSTFDAPDEALNDKLVIVPIILAQSLFDTKSVDRIGVLLHETRDTDAVKITLEKALVEQGLTVEIKAWHEITPLYERGKRMFDIIFLFVFVIVLVIVIMSVINTIGMAVLERTQEIGTLRALGLKPRGIVRLFAIESALLGAAGALVGLALTLLAGQGVRLAAPTWVAPSSSVRVPIEIYFVPGYALISFVSLILLTILAAVLPARRAAAQNIVEALGHV